MNRPAEALVDDDEATAPGTADPLFIRSLTDLPAYAGFDQAVKSVLDLLHQRLGFGLWMVTRTIEDDWIVLASCDTSYGVGPGALFRWTDSYCSRMVRGEGPIIAPDAEQIAVYREAGINELVDIGSYIGAPLMLPDGELFGTLCAIDPEPMPEELAEEADLIMLLAQLLSTVLAGEIRAAASERDAERARSAATTDPLTGLANRRAWDTIVELEEARCSRFGTPAAVIAMDLDELKTINDEHGHDAGDEALTRVAQVLRQEARGSDLVARLGGDEFAILMVDARGDEADHLAARLRRAFRASGLSVSIGTKTRVAGPADNLKATQAAADAAMYQEKHRRRRMVEI